MAHDKFHVSKVLVLLHEVCGLIFFSALFAILPPPENTKLYQDMLRPSDIERPSVFHPFLIIRALDATEACKQYIFF